MSNVLYSLFQDSHFFRLLTVTFIDNLLFYLIAIATT